MKELIQDAKKLYYDCKAQDFTFYMVMAYLVFSYLRPQVIYPTLNFIPWTQISIVAGLGYAITKGFFKIQSSHVILLVFALVVTLSAFASEYPEISIGRINVIYIWLVEVIFFTVCIRTVKQFYLITIVFFLIMFKMSLHGAKTWAMRGFAFADWGLAGPEGFFSNSGEYSLLMAMVIIMSFVFLYAIKSKKIYYLLPFTAVMTVTGASSRGGQLALLVGVAIIALFVIKIRPKNFILFIMLLFLAISFLPEQQKERFLSAGEDSTSVSRLIYWEKGLDMMHTHALLGVGLDAFPQYFRDHYAHTVGEELVVYGRSEVAHNTLIEVGSSLGYLGLFTYLWLILHCYKLNRNTQKIAKQCLDESLVWAGQYAMGINVTILVYLIGSFFMSVAFYPYVYLLMMFSRSLYNGVQAEPKKAITKSNTRF